jgi:tripartite-type tricarboxylate transporter receptor subunit TctC
MKIKAEFSLLAALALALALATAATAHAQTYPDRPIRMVVGFPPGGGTDVVARILVPRLSEQLGQQVVIENRPGATGTVAAGMVAKSAPDGYTLMMGHVSVNAIAPSLFRNLTYDVLKDFAPVTLTASVPNFIVVHPSFQVHSVKELIAYAKANPGKLSFPSAGNGSTPHLAGEMFKSLAGVNLVHVPYKGSGQSMQDLLAGQHLVAFDTVPAAAPFVRAGRLRLLAVSSARRLADFPDTPTVEEAGVPGYQVSTWYGVFAPAGTPPAIVGRLHAEINKAMQTPELHAQFAAMGADDTVTRSPEEFMALVRADTARYAKVVKDAGLKLD